MGSPGIAPWRVALSAPAALAASTSGWRAFPSSSSSVARLGHQAGKERRQKGVAAPGRIDHFGAEAGNAAREAAAVEPGSVRTQRDQAQPHSQVEDAPAAGPQVIGPGQQLQLHFVKLGDVRAPQRLRDGVAGGRCSRHTPGR